MTKKIATQNLNTLLPLMEHFFTIQGEGYHTGKAAYFLRLAGCDVGCVWCDVKESWDETLYEKVSITEMVNYVKKSGAKFCVITGGEPAQYDLSNLTDKLKQSGIYTAIETSGVYPLKGKFDWVCLSPKKFKPANDNVFKLANELKVIIYHKSDFAWAEKQAQKTESTCKLYLQPEWDKKEQILPLLVEYVKQNPRWRISLQTHKYINVP
jgi:organic radical activating enzyme